MVAEGKILLAGFDLEQEENMQFCIDLITPYYEQERSFNDRVKIKDGKLRLMKNYVWKLKEEYKPITNTQDKTNS